MSLPHNSGIVVMTNAEGGARLIVALATGDVLTPFL